MVKDYKREREYWSHQGFHESKFVTVGAAMLSNEGCDKKLKLVVIIINNAWLFFFLAFMFYYTEKPYACCNMLLREIFYGLSVAIGKKVFNII